MARSMTVPLAILATLGLAAATHAAPAPAMPAQTAAPVTCADITGAIRLLTKPVPPDIGLGFWATTPQRTSEAQFKAAIESKDPLDDKAVQLRILRQAAAERGCKAR